MEPSAAEMEARMRAEGWYAEPLLGADVSLTARIEHDARQLRRCRRWPLAPTGTDRCGSVPIAWRSTIGVAS